ncbi:MAG: hypothetical protein ACXAE3_01655 [Candidatus Kariarchaeaceae archaeon]
MELESTVTACPLCRTPVDVPAGETVPSKYPQDDLTRDDTQKKSGKQQRFEIFELVTVFGIGFVVIIFLTDFLLSGGVSWSRFPILAILAIWGTLSTSLLLYPRYVVMGVAEISLLLAFLMLLDYSINGQLTWFLDLAIWILLYSSLVMAILIYASTSTKIKGPNVVGYFLLASAVLLAGLDLIITGNVLSTTSLTWSKYAIVPLTILALLMLYYHFRFFRHSWYRDQIRAKIVF